MTFPVWVPFAISAVVGAFGAIQEGRAQASASKFNARIAESNAQNARLQAAEDERRARIIGQKQLGQIRANAGASGITLEGSPEDVLAESAGNAELDALTIRYRGELAAMGFQNDATLERQRGKNAMSKGYFSAAAQLLGGAVQGGQAYGLFDPVPGTSWYGFKRTA